MHVAVLFDRFGPYHIARLEGASAFLDVTGVEIASDSTVYPWDPIDQDTAFERVTLFPDTTTEELSFSALRNRIFDALSHIQPDAVAVPGWGHPGSLSAVQWCLQADIPAVMMSESSAHDFDRTWLRELPKRRILSLCSAALVGGRTHRSYLASLGMDPAFVFLGYDVVDNDHFAAGAQASADQKEQWRRDFDLPSRYFLASNRFVPKKNLPRLIMAFARYRDHAPDANAWDLVLLGDGPERLDLEQTARDLNVHDALHVPGFRQYNELPAFYGCASAFVHASTREQWGLVVNEAMAAGLPVLVSDQCGSAAELVHDGENGYTFSPEDTDGITDHLWHMAHGSYDTASMAARSREVVDRWGPARFAAGLHDAVDVACNTQPPSPLFFDPMLLRLISERVS